MTNIKILCVVLMLACWRLYLFAGPIAAGPLPILEKDLREAWQAVGRINGQGYRRLQGCSGTLIAPDLVVTAAHCVTKKFGIGPERHFVAGWYRGRFTAHSVSYEIDVHPLYALAEGQKRFAYDLALVHLADPIPDSVVAAVPLLAADAALQDTVLLLGYQKSVPHALAGKSGCKSLPMTSDDWLLFNCEVAPGTSGGAAIVETPEGPKLAGIIVARAGTEGHALVVPVNRWVREAWYAAMARAQASP